MKPWLYQNAREERLRVYYQKYIIELLKIDQEQTYNKVALHDLSLSRNRSTKRFKLLSQKPMTLVDLCSHDSLSCKDKQSDENANNITISSKSSPKVTNSLSSISSLEENHSSPSSTPTTSPKIGPNNQSSKKSIYHDESAIHSAHVLLSLSHFRDSSDPKTSLFTEVHAANALEALANDQSCNLERANEEIYLKDDKLEKNALLKFIKHIMKNVKKPTKRKS